MSNQPNNPIHKEDQRQPINSQFNITQAENEPFPVETPHKSDSWRFLIDVVETLVLAILLYVGINAVTARIRVDGSSMEPSFHDGEYVIVNRLPTKTGSLQRGDVIVFRFPGDPKEEYIKRLIGLPGDTVKIANHEVSVNGTVLDEPYIKAAPMYSGTWTVPANGYFVLGDNRNNSSDSHSWGFVPEQNVIGKAILIYWPPEDWAMVQHANLSAP